MALYKCQLIYDYRKLAVVVFLRTKTTMVSMVKRAITLIALALTGCLLLFATTNPESVASAAFIGVFMLLYMLVYGVLLLVGVGLRSFEVITWSKKRLHRTVLALSGYPVFLVVLQSIGQLTIRDVVLVTGFFVLAYLYAGRIFFVPKQNA